MKSLITVLVLLSAAACVPMQFAPPTIGISVPMTVASPPAIATVLPPIIPIPICPCPSEKFSPSLQPQGGGVAVPPVICSCPAILVPTTVPGNEVVTNMPEPAPAVITLADNGNTFLLHPGESFLLELGNMLIWTVEIDNTEVLSRVKNLAVIVGAQGVYVANRLGQATLSAVGDPACRKSNPPCMAPSMIFRIVVVVQ